MPVVCEGSTTCHLDIAIGNRQFLAQDEILSSVCGIRFEKDNWNTPQTFEIAGVRDQVEDGQQDHFIEVDKGIVLQDIAAKKTPFEWLQLETKSIRVRF